MLRPVGMIPNPDAAPPRPDLTFLQRRSRPRPASPSPVADFVTGRGPHPPHGQPSRPTPPSPDPSPPTPVRAAPTSSLDLSDQPPATPAPARAAPTRRVHRDARVAAGAQRLLGVTAPTVTLTRVQSGIGQLEVEAVCSPEVGDLRLGAAYQLRGGISSTVQHAGGQRFAPSSRRPVIVAGRDEYENLRLDLRQVTELERMAIYAFSESRAALTWGGTLVVSTFGGARVELPLETLFAGSVAVLLSIYNLDGELVIRAEMETITGDVREAARSYGYDRITWRDDRSPVDG